MAIKYEGSFLSEADTLEISVLCLMPEPGIKPRAIVQLVHGMSEHKERIYPIYGISDRQRLYNSDS